MARRVCVKGGAEGRKGREKVRQWNKRGVWMDSSCVVVVVAVVVVDVLVVVVVVVVVVMVVVVMLVGVSVV